MLTIRAVWRVSDVSAAIVRGGETVLIIRAVWTRRGLRRFEAEVNCRLAEGCYLKGVSLHTGLLGLRWILAAELLKPGNEQKQSRLTPVLTTALPEAR